MRVTCKVTYEGKPLEVLNDLMRRRSQQLKQHIGNAVAATMVNVLRSVRADIRNATKTKKFNIKIQDTGYYGGFSSVKKCRVARRGMSKNSPEVSLPSKVVWLTWDNPKQSECHIYRVVTESGKEYYAGARNEAIVTNNELRRIMKRINHYGGLAKNAVSVAMNKIASKTIEQDGSNISKNKASTLADVVINEQGGLYSMTMTSEVEYGTDALKSGPNAIDIAMMKAANKTAGLLNKLAEKSLGDEITTPFPEVKQRK